MDSAIDKNFKSGRVAALELLFVFAIICYLVGGTGIFSDDYALILMLRDLTPAQMILPATSSLATPVTHITHAWFYYLVQDGPGWCYDAVKIIYLFISLLMLRQFFGLWFGSQKALIVAALFVFYPIHDAVTYWFIGQYLMLSFAFLAFSFYLLQRERVLPAFAAGIFGSFISYGSPAVAFGLAVIFALRRDFRRALIYLLPNLIYIVYYLVLIVYFGKGVARIPGGVNLAALAKQYVLQIATFLDAAAGPSYWLKMSLAFGQITVISALVAALVMIVIWRHAEPETRRTTPVELLLGALALTLAAFGMFAITGLYPQLAFNLGDRVSIFGNFLMVVAIASLPLRRVQWLVVVGVYAAVAFGVSDHWKTWQLQQQTVIRNIANNPQLHLQPAGDALYVTGNEYSRYGAISHIEFLSENYMAQTVFALTLQPPPDYPVYVLNRRYRLDGEFLIDRKYGDKRPVGQSISVYDSVADRVIEVPAAEIPGFLNQLPLERRNWIQFVGEGPLRRALLYLMPRLEYAF